LLSDLQFLIALLLSYDIISMKNTFQLYKVNTMSEQKSAEFENLIDEKLDLITEQDFSRLIEPMKDIIMLAGVMSAMTAERFWDNPRYAYDTFRVFDILLRGTFYDEEAVQGEKEMVYRFERVYGEPASIDIPRLIRLCRKNNWVTDAAQPPLRLTTTGKRMVEQLFRLANDALAYHSRPPLLKEIYQARRDLQLAKAYEDVGIGRHDTIASVLSNLENAIADLKYQREKYIQDRKAIEKYHAVMSLLEMLEAELEARFKALEGIIDRRLEKQHNRSTLVFYRLLTELSLLLGENAYTSQADLGRRVVRVDRDRFLKYLVDSFSGSLPGLALTPLEVLGYMEQGVYDEIGDEELAGKESEGEQAGLWLPFSLPLCLYEEDISWGASVINEWIENWEEPREDGAFQLEVAYKKAKAVTTGELSAIIGYTSSITDELATDTGPLVEAIRQNPARPMHEILEKVAPEWGDAVRNMMVLGFLINEQEVKTIMAEKTAVSENNSPQDSSDVGDGQNRKTYLKRNWRLKYPGDRVRLVKATAALGRHLEAKSVYGRT
jgi:hypothetical protein